MYLVSSFGLSQMDKPQPLRSCREDIPKEFPEILKDLTKEILLAQPKSSREIYGVAAGKHSNTIVSVIVKSKVTVPLTTYRLLRAQKARFFGCGWRGAAR